MSEAKESSKTSKRSKRKPPMEPLGWDEIVSQPGMGGYLSFLNGPVPLPHLEGRGVDTTPGVVIAPEPAKGRAVEPVTGGDTTTGVDLTTGLAKRRGDESATGDVSIPEPVIAPVPQTPPAVESTPVSVLSPVTDAPPRPITISVPIASPGVDSTTPRLRIRRCAAAHDGHSLGEEVLYQALWKAAAPESDDTRTIVIGWRGMSQICRMTPKNCKINTQRLIRKLALEILSPYNTPESIGTTYRVHSVESILRRRHVAGLEWVVRSRGVEFVDPATGAAMPTCAVTC
jgi:hypothetical protein